MDLTTRCPQCRTEFPVSLQQLQLRKGYVRCANCAHIFDAYEAVVPSGVVEPTVPEPSVSESVESGVSIRTRAAATDSNAFTISDRGPAGRAGTHTVRDPGHGFDETDRHTVGESDTAAEAAELSATGSGFYVEPRRGSEAGPEFVHRDVRPGLGLGGVVWSLLVLVGVAAALLQAAYIYRVQLADEFPNLRPALERYCEALDCTVDYPRRLAQIAIMDSSLQAVRDGAEPNESGSRMMLNVVLRNNYERPQQWPTLSVELVDFSGTVAVRRLLAPSDYLPEISQERPFPGKSEVRISVPIVVEGVQINGYQLDRFFP